MDTEDGQSTRLEVAPPVTWFGFVTVKNALLNVNAMILMCAALLTTLMALYMTQRLQTMKLEGLLVSAISLALWSSGAGITLYGICAIWSEKAGLVEAYFWIQLVHWLLDLASTIVVFVFAYRKKQTLAQARCGNASNLQGCLDVFNVQLVLLTCGLCLYKILGAYAWYLLFQYRKALMAVEKPNPPTLRWLKRASTSSLSSLFEKKWWSPSQIPVIKIDFASDESSASVYSNDSAGYHNVNFGIPQFPTLAAPPQALFASHVGGDAVVPGTRDAYPDNVPTLPYYSVVGAERGALT